MNPQRMAEKVSGGLGEAGPAFSEPPALTRRRRGARLCLGLLR